MKASTILLIARDIISYLEAEQLLEATAFPGLQEDAKVAAAVEAILVARGVAIPGVVDKVLKALPALVALLGLA